MQRNFPEIDWKMLSRLKPLTLDRLCRRILHESGELLAHAKEGGNHGVYLELFRHIQESDKVVSECFDTWSRSHALDILINWKRENLLTQEEFDAFSPETRMIVDGFLKMG